VSRTIKRRRVEHENTRTICSKKREKRNAEGKEKKREGGLNFLIKYSACPKKDGGGKHSEESLAKRWDIEVINAEGRKKGGGRGERGGSFP